MILVVDDEPFVRNMSAELLVVMGLKTKLAADGLEALEIFEQAPDAFDAVLLDMVMPRMNGRETFHALRERNQTIPIVIASGYAEDESISALRKQGPQRFSR